MGFWSAIGSAVSSFCGGISSAVSSMGSAFSSFATGVGALIGAISTASSVIGEALGKFAQSFLQTLGILKPNEHPVDMGDRALQAARQDIKIDKFDNFDDYMKALRDFKLDPEESKKTTHAEKLVAGLGVGTVGLEDKYNLERGSLNGMWLLSMSNPEYFTVDKMQSLLGSGRLGGDVFAYLDRQLNGSDARGFEKSLEISATGEKMSGSETGKLYEALDSAQARWAEINAQVSAQQ